MTTIKGSPSDTWLHQRSRFSIIHEDPHADTWTQMGRSILIKRAGMSSHTIFIGRWIAIKQWTFLTIGHTGSGDCNRPLTGSAIGRPRRVVEELHDRGPIEPRSRRDQTTIAARSSHDRAAFVVESPPRASDGGCWNINTTIDTRSWFFWEAKLKPNSSPIGAELKPPHRPKEPLPRPH